MGDEMNISNELYEKTKSKFIEKIILEGTYASEEDLSLVLSEFDALINQMKDKDEKEMVDIVIEDSIKELLDVLNSNLIIPGFTFGVKVNGINTKVYGGFRDNLGNSIEKDTMFDLASITKTFTQVMIYNLINEGVFNFDDKIVDLHPYFNNMGDVTIRNITTFATRFKTDEKINSKETVEEARTTLFNAYPVKIGEYNYNDIGMMVLKEIMEYKTGLKYEDLLNKYIVEPLGLDRTKVNIPEMLKSKITGSPNIDIARINDSTANALGGYSGHAGIWSSNDDLVTFGEGIMNGTIVPESMIQDFYYPGLFDSVRGKVGNTFVNNKDYTRYIGKTSPFKAFSVQGSTRTQLNTQKSDLYTASSTILFNTAILDYSKVKELEESLGIIIGTEFKSENQSFRLNDIRSLIPINKSTEPLTITNSKTTLKLMFLDTLMKNYEENYDLNVNVDKDISGRIKK